VSRGEVPVLTVSEVNGALKNHLERSFPQLWVSGEVTNWVRSAQGHCYFSLKDDRAVLRCMLWRNQAERLPLPLENGMRVRVFGGITLYELQGNLQLTVREVVGEEGDGLFRLAFERLRRKLEAEGLIDPERRRPIPRMPRTVGVVTSLSGAALRDVLSVIRRRAPWTRVVVRGTRVQGEGSGAEIADAVRTLGGSGVADVLIVGRGGGSTEDLWAFNEEVVARAIVDCPVPVISAVGHEVDFTISDLVADLRAPTPAAAAEAAVPDREAIESFLDGVAPRLARGLRRGVEARRLRLTGAVERSRRGVLETMRVRQERVARAREALTRSARALVAPRRVRVERAGERMLQALRRRIDARRGELATVAGRVESLSPLSTLRRGYAVPLDGAGRLVRSVAALPPGTPFSLRLADGRVACTSQGVEMDEGHR
jgi:exodeoxyribonuclease VII large subunit